MLRKIIAVIVLIAFGASILGGVLYVIYKRTLRKPAYFVVEPSLGRPVIIPRGGSFDIRISAPAGVELEKVLLGPAVARGVSNYEIRIVETEREPSGKLAGVSVKSPYVLPTGLYDLLVQFRKGAVNYIEDRQCAVRIAGPETSFSFAVTGDPGDPGQQGMSGRKISRLKSAVRELSVLNPDFLVVLGGLGSGPWDARNYRLLRDILRDELLVPVVLLPAAGDLAETRLLNFTLSDGAEQWKRFFPLEPYTFDLAGYRFVFMFAEPCAGEKSSSQSEATGCISDESLSWLKKLIEENEDGSKRLVIFLPNTPLAPGSDGFRGSLESPLDSRSESALLEILKGQGATLFTSGMRKDAVFGNSGDVQIINTGRDDDSAELLPRYRLIMAGDEGLSGVHYRNPPHAIPFGRLRITYAKPNNGTARRNRIVVTNELGRDLTDLRALAVLAPPKKGNYEVSGADVKMRITARKHVFRLSFDVKNESKSVINISER